MEQPGEISRGFLFRPQPTASCPTGFHPIPLLPPPLPLLGRFSRAVGWRARAVASVEPARVSGFLVSHLRRP